MIVFQKPFPGREPGHRAEDPPPQLNLVIEIEFADATTALWSENAGAHPAGATLSTDFEIQNVQVLASQVVLGSALVESFNRVLRSWCSATPRCTRSSSVPNGVAEHNVTVARAFTKLMGAFVTFWDNDAGSKIHLLATSLPAFPPSACPRWCQHPLGRPCRFTFKGLDGTMTDLFIHLVAYQLATLSGTGVSVLD